MRRKIVFRFLFFRFESNYSCILLFFSLLSVNCFGQNAAINSLELNKPVERKLSSEAGTQNYQISLTADQYAKVIVEQREIDVIVQIFAPDGNSITSFDYEPRLKENEEIGFIAERAGTYRIEVKSKYINSSGNYIIRLTETRPPSEIERAIFKAHLLIAKAEADDLVGKYNDALAEAKSALEIGEEKLPKDDPYLGFLLARLGAAQRRKGDYATAEATIRRAVAIDEKTLGAEHPRTVDAMRYLGLVYLATDEFAKTESIFRQTLAITEKTLGAEHPRVVTQLLGLQTLMFYLG